MNDLKIHARFLPNILAESKLREITKKLAATLKVTPCKCTQLWISTYTETNEYTHHIFYIKLSETCTTQVWNHSSSWCFASVHFQNLTYIDQGLPPKKDSPKTPIFKSWKLWLHFWMKLPPCVWTLPSYIQQLQPSHLPTTCLNSFTRSEILTSSHDAPPESSGGLKHVVGHHHSSVVSFWHERVRGSNVDLQGENKWFKV